MRIIFAPAVNPLSNPSATDSTRELLLRQSHLSQKRMARLICVSASKPPMRPFVMANTRRFPRIRWAKNLPLKRQRERLRAGRKWLFKNAPSFEPRLDGVSPSSRRPNVCAKHWSTRLRRARFQQSLNIKHCCSDGLFLFRSFFTILSNISTY